MAQLQQKRIFWVALAMVAWGAPARADRTLSLADALATARAHRADVASAELDVRLARIDVLSAALRRVRLTLDGQWSRERQRRYINAPAELCLSIDGLCQPARTVSLVELSATLVIPVWSGFGLEAGWARARQLERAAEAAKRARLRVLALEVANAYWTVRHAQLLHGASLRAFHRRADLANLIKARAGAELAPRTDANRVETSALRQQALAAELAGKAEEARAELGAVLQVGEPFTLTDDPAGQPAVPSLAEARARARLRPELEGAAAQLAAEEQRVREVRSELWPKVDLFGRVEGQNEAFGVSQSRLIGSYSAGVLARWLLFDGLSTIQAVRRAEVERDRRSLERQRAVELVDAEVRAAHARLTAALAGRQPLRAALALARTTVDLVGRRYRSGTALLLEVLDAEDELAELEAAVIGNDVEIAAASAGLAAASGRL